MSSVSGGSVTNAIIAHADAFAGQGSSSLDRAAKVLVHYITGPGSMFRGVGAWYYLVVLPVVAAASIGLILFSISTLDTVWRVLVIMLAPAFLILIMLDFYSIEPRDRRISHYIVLLCSAAGLLASAILPLTGSQWRPSYSSLGALISAFAVLTLAWGLRGVFLQKIFTRLIKEVSPRTQLCEISAASHHVFCATEMQRSKTVYFSQDAVRFPGVYEAVPEGIQTSLAVRASAAFPIAFPPVLFPWRTPETIHTFAEDPRDPRSPDLGESEINDLVLVDGGVRDNLGVTWFEEYAPEPDELIVVSAAPNRSSRRRLIRLPGLSELAAILRASFTPYETRERRRRSALAQLLYGRPWGTYPAAAGAIVHIEDSPTDLPSLVDACGRRGSGYRAQTGLRRAEFPQDALLPDRVHDQIQASETLWRASGQQYQLLDGRSRSALAHLEAIETHLQPVMPASSAEAWVLQRALTYQSGSEMHPSRVAVMWAERAKASDSVATAFSALRPDTARNLLVHGYYLACANLHVALGWPLLAALDKPRLDALFSRP